MHDVQRPGPPVVGREVVGYESVGDVYDEDGNFVPLFQDDLKFIEVEGSPIGQVFSASAAAYSRAARGTGGFIPLDRYAIGAFTALVFFAITLGLNVWILSRGISGGTPTLRSPAPFHRWAQTRPGLASLVLVCRTMDMYDGPPHRARRVR